MSDYIERLRGELLRAGATQRRRVRVPSKRPLAIALAGAAALAAVLVLMPRTPDPEVPATSTATYRVDGDVEATARVLRERLAALGLPGTVQTSGDTVTIPESARALTRPGRLGIYDWEHALGSEQAPRLAVRDEDGHRQELHGDPALTNADVAGAKTSKDQTTGEPVVILQLNSAGRHAFHTLTRAVAARGADQRELQHLAIVVDDQVYSLPYIDWHDAPDGFDGAEGLQISARLTAAQARELAAILAGSPLPGSLTPA